MALKPHYTAESYQVGFFLNETADRGSIVWHDNTVTGSGSAMDSFNQKVTLTGNPSGKYPVGVLFDTFVNKDLSDVQLNPYKFERQQGDKATIISVGELVTDKIVPGIAPVAGQPAYLAATGLFATAQGWGGCPQVGVFLSKPDSDGYVKVKVNCWGQFKSY